MLRQLRQGNPDISVRLLVATGFHRLTTRKELTSKLGEGIVNSEEIIVHDAFDPDSNVRIGVLPSGAPLVIDRAAVETDLLISEGFIEPHFFAGFSGGRKSVLPGIAGRETIMKNHNLALNPGLGAGSNPEVRSANLSDSNPVHADMMEACAMVKPTFLINVVVDDNQKIISAFAGNWITAHKAACDLVEKMYGVAAKEKTPMVIASAGGYPKDLNFYQTIKTLCNALEVVEDGGTIILVTKSDEGFGNDDTERQIAGYETMLDREKALRENFSIGAFIGYLFAESAEKHHLIAVTGIPQEQFGTAKIHAVKTLDEALELSRQLNGGKDLRATLLPHGANTLPKLK